MINGYIPAARFLPFLSWTDVAALPDKSNTVIVLPTGAIEQHGPHLPCSVDSVISSGVAGHALARLPATIPAYAIPPIVYGKSEEHLHFPGTLTLSGDTLLHTLLEIAESLYRAGFRKLLMINGHGGQPQILQIACREMRLRHGDFIAIPHDVFNVPNCEKQFLSPHEQRMAMHAGHSETALMLALAPECVHMERAVANFPPEFPCPTLSKGRPAAAWASYDFGPSGVIGDPTPATREQGEGLLDSLAASWAQAISTETNVGMPMDTLANGPPCTYTGEPFTVSVLAGLTASAKMPVMRHRSTNSPKVTAWPSLVPAIILDTRSAISSMERESTTICMSSEVGVSTVFSATLPLP